MSDGYPIQTLRFQCQQLGLDPNVLPRWLLDITSEVRTYRHPDPKVGYEMVVYFKPENGDQIMLTAAFENEMAKIFEEGQRRQQLSTIAGGDQ
ncbi:hypothetical protein JFQ87_002254 [Aeromonas veronii]|nr:hypothetical protein [Aeromonas veronii]